MPFQFLCPNGHLLQANEDQIGQRTVCPHCRMEIIIPSLAGYSPEPQKSPVVPPDAPTVSPPVSTFTGLNTPPAPNSFNVQRKKKNFDFANAQASEQEAEKAAEKPEQKMNIGDPDKDDKLHCLCPSGHSLAISRDMIGEKAMCPYCNKTFEIKLERTVEYINKRKREEELAEKKMAKFWFQWAVVAIVLAVVFIVVMIVLAVSH